MFPNPASRNIALPQLDTSRLDRGLVPRPCLAQHGLGSVDPGNKALVRTGCGLPNGVAWPAADFEDVVDGLEGKQIQRPFVERGIGASHTPG